MSFHRAASSTPKRSNQVASAPSERPTTCSFFEAIRNRGGTVLNPDIVAQAIQNQIGDLPREPKEAGQRFGFLGAVIVDPVAANRPQAPGSIRWGGIYGHDWFIDFASGITAIMMTNTSTEGCLGEHPKKIARAIYGV